MGLRRLTATTVLLIVVTIPVLPAQDAARAPDRDHELLAQLLERVRQLEAEVKQLRERSAEPPRTEADIPKQAAAVEPRVPSDQSSSPSSAMGMPDSQGSGSPAMQFRGFSDVSFHASDLPGSTSSFALGQFNLFITSRLSERVSFLAETVMEADTRNAMEIDLERVLLQYAANDYFKVNFGRYHTAIGWYNTAYHHSSWMQTAVGRPFLYEFEDKGGILPVHNVGISATGRIPSGAAGLQYIAEIGNGRASRSPLDEPVQNVQDENNGKAFNLAVLARPDPLPGFQAGFSVYHDHLTPAGSARVGQTIMAAHAVYQRSDVEWLNEAVLVRNVPEGAVHTFNTAGFYTQISRKFGSVRPYVRYQYLNAPAGDPVFPDVGLFHGPSLGIRYDIGDSAAFKIQYDRTERRQQPGVNGLTTQISFTF